MALNIGKEVAAMRRMTPGELQEKFAEVFGEQPRSHNKQWLVKRNAWRLQANEEGDLSERARRRAMELANDADLRVTAPRRPKDDGDPVNTMPARFQTDGRLAQPSCEPQAGTLRRLCRSPMRRPNTSSHVRANFRNSDPPG